MSDDSGSDSSSYDSDSSSSSSSDSYDTTSSSYDNDSDNYMSYKQTDIIGNESQRFDNDNNEVIDRAHQMAIIAEQARRNRKIRDEMRSQDAHEDWKLEMAQNRRIEEMKRNRLGMTELEYMSYKREEDEKQRRKEKRKQQKEDREWRREKREEKKRIVKHEAKLSTKIFRKLEKWLKCE
jgi:hypothetical protein